MLAVILGTAMFRLWGMLVVVFAISGCGGEGERRQREAPRFDIRLLPSQAGVAAWPGEVRTVAEWAPRRGERGEQGWDAEADRVETRRGPNGSELWLWSPRSVRVPLPRRMRAAEFDEVLADLRSRAGFEVSGRLECPRTGPGQEGRIVQGGSRWMHASDRDESASLSFRINHALALEYETLHLDFRRATGLVVLSGVTWCVRDAAAYLPDPGGDPELVEIDGEARLAVGLSQRFGLGASIDAREGSRLRFEIGIDPTWMTPPQHVPGGEGGVFSFSLLVEGEDVLTRVRPLSGMARGRWRSFDIDLSPWNGRQMDARFELKAGAGAEGESLLCAVSQPRLVRPAANPPTVLLVTSDTHRADHVGAMSESVDIDTPVMDRLAASGVLFEDCFSSTNITNPSHIALMTATHPRDTGVVDNNTRLGETAVTLAEVFRSAGFATEAVVSARHLTQAASGLGQGFDSVSAPVAIERAASRSVVAARRALARAEGQPLFLWVHLFDAHTPYAPSGDYDRRYYPADKDPFDTSLPAPPFEPEKLDPRWKGLRDLEFPYRQYRAEVSYLDAQLGELLSLPRLSKAIAAFTADHGEQFGAHGIYWDHATLYPESIHVPLILSWPEAPAGRVSSRPVRQIDVGRTLLDLAGLDDLVFPGRSLLAEVQADAAGARYALSVNAASASVTRGKWHLILHLKDTSPQRVIDGPAFERHAYELYDLDDDPTCQRDLAAESDVARSLRTELVEWLTRARTPFDSAATDAEFEALAGLGYAMANEADEDAAATTARAWIDPDCTCSHCAP